MHQRLLAVDAPRLLFARAVKKQDGVLRHQAHQHDDADEAHEVESSSGDEQGEDDPDQGQREREHHGHGRGERAELHHEHEIHDGNAHDERDAHLGEDFVLVARGTAEGDSVATRKMDRVRDLHRIRGHLTRGAALGIGGDRDVALAAQVLDLRRALVEGDGRDLLERYHHVAAAHRHGKVFDVGGVDTIVGMQAYGYIARFARRIHPVPHLDTGKRHTQRLSGIAHRYAQLIGEPAIQLDFELVLRFLFG